MAGRISRQGNEKISDFCIPIPDVVVNRIFPFFFLAMWISFLQGSAQILTESNLPIVLINTSGQIIPNDVKIDAELKIIDNGPGQINHATDPPTWYSGRIGIEVRGASSSGYPQKPYAFETRDIAG